MVWTLVNKRIEKKKNKQRNIILNWMENKKPFFLFLLLAIVHSHIWLCIVAMKVKILPLALLLQPLFYM